MNKEKEGLEYNLRKRSNTKLNEIELDLSAVTSSTDKAINLRKRSVGKLADIPSPQSKSPTKGKGINQTLTKSPLLHSYTNESTGPDLLRAAEKNRIQKSAPIDAELAQKMAVEDVNRIKLARTQSEEVPSLSILLAAATIAHEHATHRNKKSKTQQRKSMKIDNPLLDLARVAIESGTISPVQEEPSRRGSMSQTAQNQNRKLPLRKSSTMSIKNLTHDSTDVLEAKKRAMDPGSSTNHITDDTAKQVLDYVSNRRRSTRISPGKTSFPYKLKHLLINEEEETPSVSKPSTQLAATYVQSATQYPKIPIQMTTSDPTIAQLPPPFPAPLPSFSTTTRMVSQVPKPIMKIPIVVQKAKTSKNDPNTPRKCGYCHRQFDNEAQLLQHRDLKHAKTLPCPHCGRLFKSKSIMMEHINKRRCPHLTKASPAPTPPRVILQPPMNPVPKMMLPMLPSSFKMMTN